MSALLAISGLTVGGEQLIVDNFDLDVSAGDLVGLVGESGSGKSITARAIAGLLPRGLTAGGSIRLKGTEIIGARERVLRGIRGSQVGLLMQDPYAMLNPLSRAGRHIAESRHGRMGHAEVAQRLAEVGIDAAQVANKYPFQLSGGMRQRVALAAALVGDPELLIADEPTTALDVTTQHEILQLLRSIQAKRNMALVLITHDLRVAFELCNRVAVMYAGRLVEHGPATDLVKRPGHPYTAGLIASLPAADRTLAKLVGIPGSVPSAAQVRQRCAFADRCPQAVEVCVAGRPALREVGPAHQTACLFEVNPPARAAELKEPRPSGGVPLLEVTDVSKRYGDHLALNGVSLSIAEGESVGLVGESGSGKTTLARCVLGLAVPGSGRIELGGLNITDRTHLPRKDRRRVPRLVQCVFQDPSTSLNPMMSVGAALSEALGQSDPSERATVPELLELVGLPREYARIRPGGLSGGERQRVAIARALAVRPALLVCDEPVSSLDVSVQTRVLELLRTINRQYGTSLLFITHDLAVVRQITDRTVVLFRGNVVESGRTEEVLDAPAHDYTRKLMASIPPTP